MLANIRHVGNFAAGFSTDSDNALCHVPATTAM